MTHQLAAMLTFLQRHGPAPSDQSTLGAPLPHHPEGRCGQPDFDSTGTCWPPTEQRISF